MTASTSGLGAGLASDSALADSAQRLDDAITWALFLLADAVVNARHAGSTAVGEESALSAHLLHVTADGLNAQGALRMALGRGVG